MINSDIFSKVNACTYLDISELTELPRNGLRVVVDEARIEGPLLNLNIGNVDLSNFSIKEIQTSPDSLSFELLWPFYVTYAVTPESYAVPDESAEGEGKLFCVYTKSCFLDYAKISALELGPFKHWAVYGLNSTLNVVAHDPPQLRILSPPPVTFSSH